MKPLRFLYISYFLPPLGRAESRHNVAWLRELIAHGWSAEVITADSAEDYSKDASLGEYMPHSNIELHPILIRADGGKIYRKIRYHLGLIDLVSTNGWRAILDYAISLHQKEAFDFVYSVYGVPLSHKIADEFKKRADVPWIAEFRDPLAHNYILQKQLDSRCWSFWSSIQKKRLQAFEGSVVKNADYVVVESPIHDQQLIKDYDLPSHKVAPLGVGFDSRQFPSVPKRETDPEKPLRIGYIGSLYEGYEELVSKIVEGIASVDSSVELTVVGDDRAVFKSYAKKYGLSKFNYKGRVDQVEALRLMQNLDIGLIMIDEQYELINSKFWEYLYAGLSIVALAPKSGAMAVWLEKNDAGYILPYSEKGIQDKLKTIVEDAKAGQLKRALPSVVHNYDASVVVGKLAEKIVKIVNEARLS